MGNYNVYEIKLTPVEHYFLGSENYSELGNKNDYFQRSNDFPQQTSLLGLLRYKILRDNGIDLDERAKPTVEDRDKAKNLIGSEGFDFNESDISIANVFGSIASISPVTVQVDETTEWPCFKEYVEINNEIIKLGLNKELNKISLENKVSFISKYHFFEGFGKRKKTEIFRDFTKVGTYKNGREPRVNEDSYFVKEYKTLNVKEKPLLNSNVKINKVDFSVTKNVNFVFWIALNEGHSITKESDFLNLGKEQSLFKFKASLTNKIQYDSESGFIINAQGDYSPSSDLLKIVLLSDSFLDLNALNKLKSISLFQLSDIQNFRFIKSNTQKIFYKGARPEFSVNSFKLIKKGSVIFCKRDSLAEIESILKSYKAFRQIGYNYYTIKSGDIF